jgi:hypothetical protein
LPIYKLQDMLSEQFSFKRVGMVEVYFCTLGRGQSAQVFVIGVML